MICNDFIYIIHICIYNIYEEKNTDKMILK